ncbi:MAG: TldD/PmbA family protein [Christensenellales bacterium]|jgi:PmbA protein
MNKNKNAFYDQLLKRALEAGFESAEVYAGGSESFSVSVFSGEIDKYDVRNSFGVSFRGILNGKMGYSYSEALDESSIEMMIKNAKEAAEVIENDDVQFMHDGSGNYLDDSGAFFPPLEDAGEEQKIKMAVEMEKTARGFDERIKNVPYDSVSTASGHVTIKNTLGLDVSQRSNYFTAMVGTVAEENGKTYMDYDFTIGHDISALDHNALAENAAKKTLSAIGAKPVPSGKYRAVLRNDIVCDIFATFADVFSAESAQKGRSLLAGKEDEVIANENISLFDDPLREGSVAVSSFDAEGFPTYKKSLIEKGKLMTLLHNMKTAHKQGVKSTGNAHKSGYRGTIDVAPSILVLESGEKSFEQLLEEMGSGLVITDLQGMHSGANTVSGDFSLGAKGFLVESGKIVSPVEQITVAGNFFELLKSIGEVGSDVYKAFSGCALEMPSVLLRELSVAGS